MKSYKEFVSENKKKKEFLKKIYSKSAIFLFRKSDREANTLASVLLKEGKNYDLSRDWSCRFDRAHVSQQQDHYHFLFKRKEICVVNRDGSPSHSSDLSQLPNHVKQDFEARFNILIEDAEVLVNTELVGIDNLQDDAESIKILLEDISKIIADL